MTRGLTRTYERSKRIKAVVRGRPFILPGSTTPQRHARGIAVGSHRLGSYPTIPYVKWEGSPKDVPSKKPWAFIASRPSCVGGQSADKPRLW
jgi:hypothetical protein